jgi:hypothetical protein
MAIPESETSILHALAMESQLQIPVDDDEEEQAPKTIRTRRIIESARAAGDTRESSAFSEADDDDSGDPDEALETRAPVPVRRPVGRPRKVVQPLPTPEEDEPEDEMGRRRRQKNAMSAQNGNGKPKRETFQGVPTEAIEAARDNSVENVVVKLSQRNDRGHLGHVGMYPMPVDQLLQIEEWLKDEHGGGSFMIETKDPMNPGSSLAGIPTFDVKIMAPVRAATGKPASSFTGGASPFGLPSQFGGQPFGAPPGLQPPPFGQAYVDPKFLPPFVRHLPQSAQVEWAQSNGVPVTTAQPPGFTMPVMQNTPDELMRIENERAQGQLERSRAEIRQQELAHKREIETERKRFEELRQELERQRREAETRATEARFEQIQQQNKMQIDLLMTRLNDANKAPPPPPPKGLDLGGIAAIIAAVAPVVGAMVESSRSHATRSAELQNTSMTELLKATVAKSDSSPMLELFIKTAPLMTPIVLKLIESKSPAAQADLVASLSENHMTAISMMAKLVGEMGGGGGGGEEPWWLPTVQGMLGAVVKSAESLGASNRRAVGLPSSPAPMTQLPRQTPAQTAAAEPQHVPAQVTSLDQLTGLQIAELVWQQPGLPADIRDSEGWFKLVVRLHEKVPAIEAAQLFVDHIRMLDPDPSTGRTGPGLPLVMAGFWDSSAEKTEAILRGIFGVLPIAQQDPAYLDAFISNVFELLDPTNPINKD